MKGRRAFYFWVLEFICVTAIAVILKLYDVHPYLLVPILLLFILKVSEYKIYIDDQQLRVKEQLGLLRTLLPVRENDIRCTYHIPVKQLLNEPRNLLQAFDYLPNGGGGGRTFPINKGIIGKAYRDKVPKVENFETDGDYRRRMILEYNYTIEDLAQRTANRKSYLCNPILDDDHKVLGLLYFDSNRSGTFSLLEENQLWQMIRTSSEVIRAHIT